MLTKNIHERYIKRAIELSKQSVKNGNHPFGALLVDLDENNNYENCKIILEAENSVHLDNDVTKHAELNLISKACQANIPAERKLWLYTSTEPCCMCSGAIYWSFIVGHVVYGCSEELLGVIANRKQPDKNKHIGIDLPCRKVFETCPTINNEPPIQCIGPILQKEAADVHYEYW